jgi:hypothetical protein
MKGTVKLSVGIGLVQNYAYLQMREDYGVMNPNYLTSFFIPWETPSIIQVTHMKPSLGVY